jgi:hypothetical protein
MTYLDANLRRLKATKDDFYAWSDGDKLRAFAHSQMQAIHVYQHHVPEPDPIDLQVARELLRIAARLDLVDEVEAAQLLAPAWLSTRQAATRTGKSTQTIRRWCRSGMVTARKKGRDWLVDPASIGVEP